MGRVALTCVVASLCGCSRLFGLETPMHASDASIADPDGPADSVVAPTDPPPDAAVSPSNCPATYSITVGGSTSRYRIITTATSLQAQFNDCKDDLPGATHLVAYQTGIEANNVANAVQGSSVRLYIGAVQLPSQNNVATSWFAITGEALPTNVWDTDEPNDIDGAENGEEQIACPDPPTR